MERNYQRKVINKSQEAKRMSFVLKGKLKNKGKRKINCRGSESSLFIVQGQQATDEREHKSKETG